VKQFNRKSVVGTLVMVLCMVLLAVFILPAIAQAQGRVTWETNYTFTAINNNDNSNSTVAVNANYTGGRHVIAVEVENDAAGALCWSLDSNITTAEVASVVSIPKSTTKTIYLGEGYAGPIAFRYQTVATNADNTVKIKLWGTN
jgi:hypothetical protein